MGMTAIEGLRGIPSIPSVRDPRRTGWRRQQLMLAGLDELTAHRLATRSDVDIHEVLVRGVDPGQPRDARRG